MTLRNMKGNAFDIASLEIALLRASGINARYQYATINVSADKVMNWVGGVTTPEAALSILSQGGIPCIGLFYGGRINTIQMEHVYVEAYVDVVSGGARTGSGVMSWFPLDASFKQYNIVAPQNLATAMGFDQTAYAQTFLQSAVVDPSGNSISGGDAVDLGYQIESYQSKAVGWAKTVGIPQAINQATGTKTIRPFAPEILMGSLPYQTVALGGAFQTLPANLRWTLTVGYFGSEDDVALSNPMFSQNLSLPAIDNQKLDLSFAPATAADATALQNLQTQNATSLPAYVINGVATLSLDGKAIATGGPESFGAPRIVVVTINDPQTQNTTTGNYNITTGDETVFAINAAGITQKNLDDRFAQTPSTTASENLQTVALTYWMLYDLGDQFAAAAQNVVAVRLPSVGAFAAPLVTQYFFGIARSGYYKNRHMDVQQVRLAATTLDGQVPVSFVFQSGIQGSNDEGLAFDTVFNRQVGTAHSATRFLGNTLASGGAVLRITAANQAIVATLPIPGDVQTDVLNAVAAGKIAIVPNQQLTIGAWQGMGYILMDPLDGSGAYLINGGYNGGDDDGGCSAEPVTEPVSEAVRNQALGFAVLFAIVVLCFLAAPEVLAAGIAAAIAGVALATVSISAEAAPGPLPPSINAIWQNTFGNAFGNFPSGPNYPGDNINRCGDALSAMEAEKDQVCDGGANPMTCSGNDCPAAIEQKIANRNACIAKRLEIMFTCYNGGDGAHWNVIQEHLNGLNKCQGCLATANGKQCTP